MVEVRTKPSYKDQLIKFHCRFCDSRQTGSSVSLPDSMNGSERTFAYLECLNCYSLQIKDIPLNLSEFYPHHYRSYVGESAFRKVVSRLTEAVAFKGFLSVQFLLQLFGFEENALRAINRRGYRKDAKILELGCGSGRVLRGLHKKGFKNLVGSDPFAPADCLYDLPFQLVKKSISQLEGDYDLIIANHVFEHLPDPHDFFYHVRRLLAEHGELLLLVPVANCHAWKVFRENWIQADAPRHLNIPSINAIELLVKRFNMRILDRYFNGTEFQLIGSQECRAGIALTSAESIYAGGFLNRLRLMAKRISLWSKIRDLNLAGESDQVVLYISSRY